MGMTLRAEGLSFAYPGRDAVWADVDLAARPGRVLSILGPNGTGKSTLLRCLAGLVPPRTGRVLAGDQDLAALSRRRTAQAIAMVPQTHTPVFTYRALDVVVMGRTPHLGAFASPNRRDFDAARGAMETMGISHLENVSYSETSGGERQLILFARSLAQGADILLLDEPTSHLDFGNQARTLALIRSLADRGLTVIMTTHFPDHAFEISDQTALLARGRLQAVGSTETVLSPESLSSLYGLGVDIHRLDNGRTVCTVRREEP
ncbi:putative ABC transporter ATP-binding protein [Pseudodesulfovibrio hydrargyri]|uniref:Putative ABC transporter ATP-binding protein n=1 Tax=Pseudodesulfovibrio hydrargyri TaxID=2125990 RepID=A0A1J5N8D9_9BACT|nr:ABC transporter ATP-binding protein [Pseudodesulfovibrio hydrargyri]OIQ49559.1 putative ABC transporter ATP-binding protein [Pseudodesulfovibrio hydrargyri]